MTCGIHRTVGNLRDMFNFDVGDVLKGISRLRFQFIICPECRKYDMKRYVEMKITGVEL